MLAIRATLTSTCYNSVGEYSTFNALTVLVGCHEVVLCQASIVPGCVTVLGW